MRDQHGTNALCRRTSGIHRSATGSQIALDLNRNQPGIDLMHRQQPHVSGFEHRIRGLNSGDVTNDFDESQRIYFHYLLCKLYGLCSPTLINRI